MAISRQPVTSEQVLKDKALLYPLSLYGGEEKGENMSLVPFLLPPQ